MESLEPLVGAWDIEMVFWEGYGLPPMHGQTEFSWVLDGAFLLQTSSMEHPKAPNGHILIGEDGDAFAVHYFDSRGVVRRLEMEFGGGVWKQQRLNQADFDQRQTVRFSDDGMSMAGSGELTENGAWRHDYDITYTRRG